MSEEVVKRGPGRPRSSEKPADPEAVRMSERTARDMAQATERLNEEQDRKARIAAEDAEKIAADQARRDAEAKEIAEKQAAAEKAALEARFTEQELMDFDALEARAKSGKPVPRHDMMRLALYRKREKVLAEQTTKKK